MTLVVTVIGVLASLVGLVGAISPDTIRQIAGRFRGAAGRYASAITRLMVGALLVWTGSACRPDMPWVGWTVRGIGVLAIAAALTLLLMGHARFQAILDWSLSRPEFLRGTSLIALVVGVFLIYAAR
jgi:hypothetical protein